MPVSDHARGRAAALGLGGVLALVVVVALVASTLFRGADPDTEVAPPVPSDTGTPLAEVDTRTVAVARDAFCESVNPEAVARAVGSDEPGRVRTASWENGERARLDEGLRDVAHEYGCSWRGPDGTVARAWVFAPPVTRREARTLAETAATPEGCSRAEGAPAFGVRSVALDCQGDGERERSFRGLFGDAWLTCGLREKLDEAGAAAPDGPDLAERASLWCGAVLAAATAAPAEQVDAG